MGCLLGCFGFKNTKNRRKPNRKNRQNHASYIPLDSDSTNKLDSPPKHIISSDSKLKEKQKEPSFSKIRKKVSFNLNVTAYEPLPVEDDTSSCLEDESKWEFNKETITTTYPQSYRYQNFNDSYGYEDEELAFEEDDYNFEENEDSDDEDGFNGDSDESDGEVPSEEDPLKSNLAANEPDNESGNARDRSRYVMSVLNPVENLSQWKAVKAKAAARLKPRKENAFVLEDQSNEMLKSGNGIPVDASLSNWLGSLETQRLTKKDN